MSGPLIRLEKASKRYLRGGCWALKEVDCSIDPGEYVSITGPSGSGKSTLLHIICGIDVPSSGNVFFRQRAPRGVDEWARIRARHIGLVFQSFHLLPTLTAAENVQIPMFGIVRSAGDRKRRSEVLLERVGLADRANHHPGELSGGEQQRLAVARSLANDPDVILADEPTGNLDSTNAENVMRLLEDLFTRNGITLVIVTHDTGLSGRARRRISLLDGRILSDNTGETKA